MSSVHPERHPVLIIPAYKPSPVLPELVEHVLSSPQSQIHSAVIVDDGSGPEYRDVFQRLEEFPNVVLVRHAINLGKGAALKTGFNRALVMWPDCPGLVTADADGQHAADDIIAVGTELARFPDHLILGVRGLSRGVPLRSRFGNSLTRRVFSAFTGTAVTDTQTGLRGWPRRQCLEALRVPLNGYDFELECLVSGGRPIREVPVATIYIDQNQSSHFNPIRDSMRIYFVFLRYCGSAALAALVDSFVFYSMYSSGASTAAAQVAGRTAAVLVAFFVARNVVFRSDARLLFQVPRYLALVVVMGFISYHILEALHSLDVPLIAAKLLAEGLLFLGNFAIQRDFIFVRR